MLHQHHHNTPMDCRSGSPHQNEPGNVPVCPAGIGGDMNGGGGSASAGSAAHKVVEHSRSLCIAVDDFGLHAGVCEAALQLAMHGRAQAIGCMVGAPAWVQWAPRLQDIDPCQTETGLHLDLTEHPLVLRAQGLGPLIAHSWLRTLRPTDIRNEIRIQLDMFEQHTGK